MAAIRIRVGASLDSDLANVFRPLRDEARRARQQVAQDQRAADKQSASQSLAVWREQFKEQGRLNREMLKGRLAAARDTAKQEASAAKDAAKQKAAVEMAGLREAATAARTAHRQENRERLSDFEATVREMTRMEDRAQRSRVRAGMGLPPGGGGRGYGGHGGFYGGGMGGFVGYLGGRHVVQGAGRDFGRIARGAGHMLGDVGRGLGIEFDLSSIVRRNTELTRKSQEVANAGYQPGVEGVAGKRVSAAEMEDDSRKVAQKWGLVTTEVADAHKEFVNVTGDLATSRALMDELGKMSAATGSEMNDLARAAAKVSVQLPGQGPAKNEKILDILRSTLAQGKLGGAELASTAVQMAALTAVSGRFGGDPAKNMKLMGVLFQESIQHGGSKNPAQAATSVMSFANLFSKPARLKQIQALIGNPRDAGGFLKDPQELIVQLLRHTAGRDDRGLSKAVADVRSKAAIFGFQKEFLQASHGKTDRASVEAGTAAVRAEFARLSAELENNSEIEKAAALRMADADKKAHQFQASLDQVGKGLQEKLGPALEKLAPKIIELAEGFGQLVEWAAGNPWQAASLALAASVAKAGIGEVIARALGISVVGQAMGGVGGGIGAVGAAAGLGGLVATLGLAAVSIAALGLAADQASKLWNELHPTIGHAPGTTPEEAKKLDNMSPAERAKYFATQQAIGTNKAAFEAAGYAAGGQLAGPPQAQVAEALDADKLLLMTEEQTKMMRDRLRVEIVNIDELLQKSGSTVAEPPRLPGGGIMSPLPKPPSVFYQGGASTGSGSSGGAAAH